MYFRLTVGSTPVIAMVSNNGMRVGPTSQNCQCPSCHSMVTTRVKKSVNTTGMLAVGACLFFG